MFKYWGFLWETGSGSDGHQSAGLQGPFWLPTEHSAAAMNHPERSARSNGGLLAPEILATAGARLRSVQAASARKDSRGDKLERSRRHLDGMESASDAQRVSVKHALVFYFRRSQ